MNLQTSVKTVLTEKYMTFEGRASRSEYWWFFLAYLIGSLLVMFVPFLPVLYALAMFLPFLAVGFRRMHDIGKPGWYFVIPSVYNLAVQTLGIGSYELDPATGAPVEMPSAGGAIFGGLLSIIGLIIAVVFLWWLTRPSEPETNAYGPPPAS